MLDAGRNQFVEGLVIMSLINCLLDLVIAGRPRAAETCRSSFHELPVRRSFLVDLLVADAGWVSECPPRRIGKTGPHDRLRSGFKIWILKCCPRSKAADRREGSQSFTEPNPAPWRRLGPCTLPRSSLFPDARRSRCMGMGIRRASERTC